ncbi:MAG: TIGR00289 family protein [Candidatus Aenigmarchaeota archaeon]|nr:TIGR00289 family protein [Candidatus Aenigmarchaeota archaeon]
MQLAALYSGGKDSTYAVWRALQEGHEVQLLAFVPENQDSYMFHHPNISWTRLQAEAMGLPLQLVATKGEKEGELADLEEALRDLGVRGVAAGALASTYQKSRVERICGRLGLQVFAPAWGRDPLGYWQELLAAGFRVMITKVACDGLGKDWLGRVVDRAALEELAKLAQRYRFHLAFEGGEAESFVLDCPLFRQQVEVRAGQVRWDGETGVYEIVRAELAAKG